MKEKYRLLKVGEKLALGDYLCRKNEPSLTIRILLHSKEIASGEAFIHKNEGATTPWPYGHYSRLI